MEGPHEWLAEPLAPLMLGFASRKQPGPPVMLVREEPPGMGAAGCGPGRPWV